MWVDLLPACAPTVHPYTMTEVVRVEHGSPLALHVNGLPADKQPHARTKDEAVALASYWIARGYSVDLGLTQTNSRNLLDLHLTLEQVLGDDDTSECANLRAGSTILTQAYGRAIERFGEGQGALAAALSAYNTGGFTAGFTNGYVARYYGPVPALTVPQVNPREPGPVIRTALVNRHSSDTDVW
jgi:type IV secretion system protein VirB1